MVEELIKDLAKYAPSYLVPALIGLFTVPIVTRLFPPEIYGNYVLVTSTVSLLMAITTAWLSSSIIRFFSTYENEKRLVEFYGTIIKLVLFSIVVVALIFSGILFFSQNHIFSSALRSLMFIGVPVFIATSVWSIMLTLFRAKRQATWYSSLTIWYGAVGLGLGLALVMGFHYGVEGLLWGSSFAIIIALPLVIKFGIGKLSFSGTSFSTPMALVIAKYGFPITVVNIVSWIITLSDRYLLQLFRGSAEVGIYSVSNAISGQTMIMISSIFLIVQGPLAYNIWEKRGIEASREFTNKFSRYYLLIGIPAAVGLAVLASPLVKVLSAPEYYPGYRIIPLVVFGAFINGIINNFTIGLTFYRRTDLLMYCTMGAALLSVGLNFLLIPRFGYMGAAITSLITWVSDLIIIVIISKRFFIWPFPFKSLAKISCASVVMGAVVYPVGHGLISSVLLSLILGILIGVIVYVIMLFIVKEPQKEEISVLLRISQRVLGR